MLVVERQSRRQIRKNTGCYWNGMMEKAQNNKLHIDRRLRARHKELEALGTP